MEHLGDSVNDEFIKIKETNKQTNEHTHTHVFLPHSSVMPLSHTSTISLNFFCSVISNYYCEQVLYEMSKYSFI